MCRRTLIFLALTLYAADHLAAQALDVALLGAESDPAIADDVEAKLIGTGLFNSVTQVNVIGETPSLSALQAFDAVLTWTNASYQDSTALGDNLADYVDAGGGVVCMMWTNTNFSTGTRLGGRWETGGYTVIQPVQGYTYTPSSLGAILEPGHPVLENFSTFDGGTSAFRGFSESFSPAAELLAQWADGLPLVVVDESHQTARADLNFHPASSDWRSDMWVASTDGALLMANALEWSVRGSVPDLSFPDVIPGAYLTFQIRRVSPGNEVVTVISSLGAGPTTTLFGIIEVTQPWFQTPPFSADAEGVVEFTTTLPVGATGRTLYSQAVELLSDGTAELSNPVALLIP